MAKRKESSEEVVVKMISPPKLKSLCSTGLKAREDIGEIRGAFGQEVKIAKEKYGLHPKAFNVINGMYGWSPEKLREFKDHFDFYWDVSGLEKKAESAPRLPMGDEPGNEEEDNIHRLQPGAA